MAIRELGNLTFEEVRDLDRPRTVCVMPVGAIEAHRPHRAYFGWPADATAEEGRASVVILGGILADAMIGSLGSSA